MRNIDKFRGCLIGGAAGDALGYAIEFDSEEEIRASFGKDGITAYVRRDGLALISDDTQMTLFTAEGLLLANGNASDSVNSIRQMYLDWYCKQHPRRNLDGMHQDAPDELDCMIELPYRMCRNELYPCPLEL